MAAIVATQITHVGTDGNAVKVWIARLVGVTAADTLDVGTAVMPVQVGTYKKALAAFWTTYTGTQIACAAPTGTSVVIPAGPSNDDGWLTVVGEGS